ncbi:hypothetical protein [Oxalobacter formigenes]|nr:hypothetical protein [Oxalobacter formigenes]WAW00881.1 hypothetical protein NB644_07980 [Oxalobacter formigenes]WAW03211.1 hypothetical protein NB642_08760 [Oxalobacter formigenes]WAW06351.1 hypothetical protein NB639_02785 [Oxalobacter formigenes]
MYCVTMTYGSPPISRRGLRLFAGFGAWGQHWQNDHSGVHQGEPAGLDID